MRQSDATGLDITLDVEETPVTGIEPRIDALINERFRALIAAVVQLQVRTLIEPAAVAPPRAYDGQIVFADGVNWSPDGSGAPGLYYFYEGEWHEIADDSGASGYMRWRNVWSGAQSYQQNDVAIDDGWLMCANQDTNERPAPQPEGPTTPDLPDTPAWTHASFEGLVWSAHEYTFTTGGWLRSISVWVDELTNDTNYRIILIDDTDNAVVCVVR